jgi:hypothetical protein
MATPRGKQGVERIDGGARRPESFDAGARPIRPHASQE